MLAARLTQLKVKTLVIDRNARIGDNWRNRYYSLTLHNEICTNHFPYLPFPDNWPVYIPKDKLANWFDFYAESLELNVWMGTNCVGARYDPVEEEWIVELQTVDGTTTLRPKCLVLATGVSGLPNMPNFPGRDNFSGCIIHSSSATEGIDANGKSVIIIGSGTSAHDLAQDFHLRGAAVTMVQRSSSTVVSLEPASVRAYETYRRGEGLRPIADIDLMTASLPFDLVRRLHVFLSGKMAEDDAELLAGLRDAGFLLDNGDDDTGFFLKLLRSLGGYYINVGASNLIIDRKIALRSGVGVEQLDESEVLLSDGTRLTADIVVAATGYLPLQETVRSMLGDEIADRVGPIWGIGDDGELRNMFAATAQPGFFVVGGPFTLCRIYSRYTAFLIRSVLGPRTVWH
jgi:cation diffusion facilitator CzcD-associated flavoprotein CzcO